MVVVRLIAGQTPRNAGFRKVVDHVERIASGMSPEVALVVALRPGRPSPPTVTPRS